MYRRNNTFAARGMTSLRDAHRPLSDEQIRQCAPSAFAAEAHASRSDRYVYIPTSDVIAGMRNAGFLPVSAKQGNSRVPGKEAFTKHLIRFRPAGEIEVKPTLGGLYPEVALLNSHDGTSGYKIIAGCLRLACLNGMLVADNELASVSVPHKGNIVDRVIEGTYTVINESRRAVETADHWAGIELGRDAQMALAESVHMLRFGEAQEGVVNTVTPQRMLEYVRRQDDVGSDLWRVTSRLQENAIRGGLHGMSRNSANNTVRRVTTRPIENIDGDVKLNRALWHLSERMASILSGAHAV